MGEAKRRESEEMTELREYYASIGEELDLFVAAVRDCAKRTEAGGETTQSLERRWRAAAVGLAAMIQRDGIAAAVEELPEANAEVLAEAIAEAGARAKEPFSLVTPKTN